MTDHARTHHDPAFSAPPPALPLGAGGGRATPPAIPGVDDPDNPRRQELLWLEMAATKGWLGGHENAAEYFEAIPAWCASIIADEGEQDDDGNWVRKPKEDRIKARCANILRAMAADRIRAIETLERIRQGGDAAGRVQSMQVLIVTMIQRVAQHDPTLAEQLSAEMGPALGSSPAEQRAPVVELVIGDDVGTKASSQDVAPEPKETAEPKDTPQPDESAAPEIWVPWSMERDR